MTETDFSNDRLLEDFSSWLDLAFDLFLAQTEVCNFSNQLHMFEKITLLYDIVRGGNAEKRTFDWVIAPLKYGCVLVEWVLGFNKKYFKFHFGH